MEKYKKKKKFKKSMFLIRNEKYPDSTIAKAGAWCVLRNIKSSTEFDIEWQKYCPKWNYQQDGIYSSKLFKKAPIWPEGTKLRYKKDEYWLGGAECIVTEPPILFHGTILMKIKWIKWSKFYLKPADGMYCPWNFEVIK